METKNKLSFVEKLKNQKKQYLILEIIVLVLLIVYLIGAIYFNNKFLPGTKIDNVNVGGLTISETNDKLSKHISAQSLSLKFNDGKTETIDSSNLGATYNSKNSIGKVLNKQNSFAWITNIFTGENNVVEDLIKADDASIKNAITGMDHAQASAQVAPTDATVEYKSGSFTIKKESEGSTLNIDKLVTLCKEAVISGENEIDVSKDGGYQEPAIKSTDKSLESMLSLAKKHCNASFTYKCSNGKTFTLDGTTMATWLTKTESNTYEYNEDNFKTNLTAYVKTVAASYNSVGQSRTFTGADGASHTVSGGSYGVRINTSEEVTDLMSLISKNTVEENRTPKTTGQAASNENGGLGNTFVEIDLTKQHVWFHKDGAVVWESDCVSGKATDSSRATPTGTYYITYKQRGRTLRGTKLPNGQWPYETYVEYWMPFNNGIGLHDLKRSAYGGSVYINNGSHGCINLPTDKAASLFSLVSTNDPVVVYKS
ncbi:MAG: L,D-transpeptidase family protein [Thomasclavelia sp.]|nr:L,D-transpeptidase family protein [Thomasclavelia sp.]